MFRLSRQRPRAFPIACLALAIIVAMPAARALARSNWSIDPARTHIGFTIDAVGWPRTIGKFERFEGRIAVDFDHPAQSRVSFHVQTQSVDVGSPTFSDYVRSVVLLNAARFPTIDFTSTSVEKLDDHSVRVTGDLTLLGTTRPLSVDVDVSRQTEGGRTRLGFTAKARIDRLAFGMNSGFPIISRDVELTISTEAQEL
jgi:polyisoprenoid-binding protein YceI